MADEPTLRRLAELESQVAELTRRVYRLEGPERTPAQRSAEPPSTPSVPEPPAPRAPLEIPLPPPAFASAPAARSGADWEATLGASWFNRIGVFVLVVGIALLLGYSFRHMGRLGRDAVGVALGGAMLAGGVIYERRPRYRNFARGLIGGGWAALYFTAYAMQALDAARVIDSPAAGALLLTAVACGMIAHAIRYRSEAVAGLAYFSAFGALAITQVTVFSLVALFPLAASLLYVARRFDWRRMALMGLVATWVVCASRGDTGAPLWAAQALFTVYWLLFEGFEILVPGAWLMPLNAAGFLGLSLLKWQAADPKHVWVFLLATAVAYAVGGALRARLHPEAAARAGGWHGPATAAAGLGALAILLHLREAWALAALLALGEGYFLAGLRLRAPYLRALAVPLFALEMIHLAAWEAPHVPVASWMPVAALTAAVFYGNRVWSAADMFYGYAATAVAALIAACEAPARVLTVAWGALGLALLATGFPLRDRVLRLSGLALLIACILKLFFYDLRYLDTLPRILSFLILGVILLGVSWIYTRFRDRVQKYL